MAVSAKSVRARRARESRQLKYSFSKARNRGMINYPRSCSPKRITEWLPGDYNSEQSLEAYRRSAAYFTLHGEVPPWVSGGSGKPPADPVLPGSDDIPRWPSIDQLCEQWSDEHLGSYSKSEQYLYRTAMTRLRILYGGYPTNEFGKSRLKEVRKLFAKAGNCVRTINGQMRRLRTIFLWGSNEDDPQLVPDGVVDAMRNLKKLEDGDRVANVTVEEYGEVPAVCDEVLAETIKLLRPAAVDLVSVLRYSAARSGELFKMTVGDLKKKSPELWIYEPKKHKTSRWKHKRTIRFGPKSIAILARLIKGRSPSRLVFVRPGSLSEQHVSRWARPGVELAWNRDRLGGLIARVCRDHDIEHWHPHQLRHAAATEAYNRKGGTAAAAQALCGHHRLSTTERYIDVDDLPADGLARQFG